MTTPARTMTTRSMARALASASAPAAPTPPAKGSADAEPALSNFESRFASRPRAFVAFLENELPSALYAHRAGRLLRNAKLVRTVAHIMPHVLKHLRDNGHHWIGPAAWLDIATMLRRTIHDLRHAVRTARSHPRTPKELTDLQTLAQALDLAQPAIDLFVRDVGRIVQDPTATA